MLTGLRNTPFLYYGEEIGMENVDVPEDKLQDPARFRSFGRDPERTPMQWDASPGRGFSQHEPWLPFGRVDRNVAAQLDDPDSLLALVRRAIWLRKRAPVLLQGAYRELDGPPGVLLFERELDGSAAGGAVNTETAGVTVRLAKPGDVILSTEREQEGIRVTGELQLAPLGAAIVLESPV
jgi:alpha-glucosidase